MSMQQAWFDVGQLHARAWLQEKDDGTPFQGVSLSGDGINVNIHGMTAAQLAQLVAELSREQILLDQMERAARGEPDPGSDDCCVLGLAVDTPTCASGA